MANKPQINYLARDFDSIKDELVTYAKRFYPRQFNDFSEASFGSFMLDAVAYLGDVMSFQLDYQSNENNLSTAINRENIIALARQMGYSDPLSPNVTGVVTIFLNIPSAANNAGPDTNYLPVLKRGTAFSTTEGAVFSLTEDVDFSEAGTDFVVSEVDSTTGIPTKYAAKRDASVASGIVRTVDIPVADQTQNNKFFSTDIEDSNVIEVISVFDIEGNEYFEVDALTQNIIYKALPNQGSTSSNTINVLIPTVASRRFVTKFQDDTFSLIFGNGKEDSDSVLDSVNDPTKVVLQKQGKDYVSTTILDPTVLKATDKFGIGPSNTELTVTYRANTSDLVSAPQLSLVNVENATFVFSTAATDTALKNDVRASIEVENQQPIAGSRLSLTDEEIREVVMGIASSQGRVVTPTDYVNFSYRMPAQFGAIKRASAIRDDFSPRRSINLYVLSEDDTGALAVTSQAVKDNLKVWLSQYKTVSDSVDILDGRIINFGVRFSFVSNRAYNNTEALSAAIEVTQDYFNRRKYNFGESINVSELVRILNDTEQVTDIIKIEFVSKTGGSFSDIEYDFIKNTTTDGRFITIPEDYVFEIKLFSTSITAEAV
tara:strand:+ start:2947 stop:4749 length:1803 start_codon:yes stop_codon:yes gene_type:complete